MDEQRRRSVEKTHEAGRLRGSARIMGQVFGFCFLRQDVGTKIGGERIGNGRVKRWN